MECGEPVKKGKKFCAKHHRVYESIQRRTYPNGMITAKPKAKGKSKAKAKAKKTRKKKRKAGRSSSGTTSSEQISH